MDVREKLIKLFYENNVRCDQKIEGLADDVMDIIDNGVTVQEYGEWVHPKGYVVLNGFLCSKCGHQEASHCPINPRPSGGCMSDENGNFYHPPKINYCPHCGAKMMPLPPKGE